MEAARAAGDVIASAFNKPKAVEHKGSVDLVTETDKASENLVYARIKEAYPSHKYGSNKHLYDRRDQGLAGAVCWTQAEHVLLPADLTCLAQVHRRGGQRSPGLYQ